MRYFDTLTPVSRVGITGTHHGGTLAQYHALREFLIALSPRYLHEGDCIGVDAQAAFIATGLGIYVVAHPPENPRRRAYATANETRTCWPYIVRDHHIVDETEMLIGVPRHDHEVLRSGTWATIRYAVKVNKPVHLILPDGRLILYNKGASSG
jgi:hypothetical protein